jgi:hypothetical protein
VHSCFGDGKSCIIRAFLTKSENEQEEEKPFVCKEFVKKCLWNFLELFFLPFKNARLFDEMYMI